MSFPSDPAKSVRVRSAAALGATALVCACALAADTAAPTPDDVRRAFARLSKDVAALRTARNAMASEIPHPRPGMTDGCLALDLDSAVAGKPLHIELLRRDGRWEGGRAQALQWNLDSHIADPAAVAIEDRRIAGRVTVRLVPWSDRRQQDDSRGVPMACTWDLDLAVKAPDRIAGQARLANPESAPLCDAPLTATGRWIPLDRPAFRPDPPKPDNLEPFDEAAWLGQCAVRLYEDIRALHLSQQSGLPFELTDRDVTHCAPARAETLKAAPVQHGGHSFVARKGTGDRPSLDGSLGESADPESDGKAAEDAPLDCARVLAQIQRVAEHVLLLKAAVDEVLNGPAARGTALSGDIDGGDPEFGPWDDVRLMARGPRNVQALPDDAGSDGPQTWPAVGVWRVLGPFPLSMWPSQTAVLPDIVPAFDAGLRVEVARFPGLCGMGAYRGDGASQWAVLKTDARSGRISPPAWMKNHANNYMVSGMDFGAFYAATEIESPIEATFWASVHADDAVALWVNGRLAWRSGAVDNQCADSTWRLRIPLRKGNNRLLARCENTKHPHRFGLRVCVKGGPRPAAVARSQIAAREAAVAGLTPVQGGIRGYRHDQSGCFPGPAPVAAWDLERKINVLWRTPLALNHGTVTAGGGRVFAWEDPCTLVCLDAADGKIVWRRDVDAVELLAPDVFAKVQTLKKELEALPAGASASERRREIIGEANRLYRSCGRVTYTPFPEPGYCGPAMATPLTDGKRVWVKSVAHAVACFDLEGNRRWMRPTGAIGGGMGHSVAAPILVSGKLICQVPRYGQPNAEQAAADPAKGPAELQAAEKGPGTSVEVDDEAPDETTDRHESRRQVLKAWDAETGQEAWTSGDYKLEHFGNRYDADAIASPHPMRLTDGSNSVDVVVTTAGHVFRADDGRRLLENAAVANDPAPTPISDGKDVIYFMRQDYGGHSGRFGRATAVRLVLRGRDRVEAVVLWNRVFQGQNFGGFLLNGGVLHAYPGYREPFGAVVRLDAATGTRLNAVDFVARHQHGEGYAAPVAAGGVMVVGDTGRSDRNRFLVWKNPQLPPEERQPLLPGNMTTLLAGPDGFVLARNDMDGISLSPAIDEGRLFVRCRNALVCLGTTGAEGERYEAEQVAATLLTQLPPAPSDGPVVEPKAQSQLPSQYVPEDLPIGIPVCRWACVGPLTPSERDPAAKAIEFPVGARCIGDRTRRAEVCEIRQFDRPSAYPSDFLTENQAFGLRLDLARVHQGKAGTAALWTTVLRNDRRRVLRLELDGAPAKFWIGGTAVANGTRVRLTHGDYLLAMETALADGTPKEVPLRVCFWPSDDLERERAARQAAVQRLRPYFERAARLVPATDGGRRAADALAGL